LKVIEIFIKQLKKCVIARSKDCLCNTDLECTYILALPVLSTTGTVVTLETIYIDAGVTVPDPACLNNVLPSTTPVVVTLPSTNTFKDVRRPTVLNSATALSEADLEDSNENSQFDDDIAEPSPINNENSNNSVKNASKAASLSNKSTKSNSDNKSNKSVKAQSVKSNRAESVKSERPDSIKAMSVKSNRPESVKSNRPESVKSVKSDRPESVKSNRPESVKSSRQESVKELEMSEDEKIVPEDLEVPEDEKTEPENSSEKKTLMMQVKEKMVHRYKTMKRKVQQVFSIMNVNKCK